MHVRCTNYYASGRVFLSIIWGLVIYVLSLLIICVWKFGVDFYFMTDLMMNLILILEDTRVFCGIGIGVDGGLLLDSHGGIME